MKKILSIVIALMFVLSCTFLATATVVVDENVTYWYPWVKDGGEITLGSVVTSDEGIVADYSSNWEIKAQDNQPKITESYMSPATVWTTDATQDFVLAYEVEGGSKVQIGFLHTVGAGSVTAGLATVEKDGSDLGEFVKLYSSVDGTTWAELTTTFTGETVETRTPVLVNGMTGYDEPITTNVGDGDSAYSEFYFIAEATVPADATLVKYVYFARTRSNTWDPCIRDAAFTAPVVEESETSTTTPDTGDMTYAYVLIAVVMLGVSIVVIKKSRA
ncbi:MAG: hypothetical protein A2Y17_05905 [Clostridiales bacterium GWF2_38_85]|nr:MAG: hypothetical protein A2Y17_05905 [Clostridiales bacterium GWF2_38_85]HBL84566.1 hypothetical protein [Clostridiales bacterium]